MDIPKYRLIFSVFALTLGIFSCSGNAVSVEMLERDGRIISMGRIFGVAAQDLNQDGHLDLVESDFLNPSRILYNTGQLEFSAKLLNTADNRFTGGHGLALGDFNLDGNIDIYLLYNGRPSRVLFGDGGGEFVDSGQLIGDPDFYATSVTTADVDDDGDLDVFMTYFQDQIRLYLNDGEGEFETTGQAFGFNGSSVATGDIDRDGDIDAICRLVDQPVQVWQNVDGAFILRDDHPGDDTSWGPVLLEDLDQDTDLDLILGSRDLPTSIMINDGTGLFSQSEQQLNSCIRVTSGDIDGDGAPDLVVGNTIWLNTVNGQFEKCQSFSFIRPTELELIDIDGDSDMDLLVAERNWETEEEYLKIYLNKRM